MRSITMSRVLLSGALALGALGAIGGFTPGVATAHAEPSVSQFAGSWSGTWAHVTGDEDVGTFEWTISDAGQIKGTGYNITSGEGGTIVGHVCTDGKLMMNGFTPGDDPTYYDGAPFRGTAVIDDDGKLVVSVTGTWSGALSFVAILERN